MSYRPQTVASWYPPYQLSDSIHTMSWFGTPHFAMQPFWGRDSEFRHMLATVVAFNDSNRKNKFFIHFVLESPLERST